MDLIIITIINIQKKKKNYLKLQKIISLFWIIQIRIKKKKLINLWKKKIKKIIIMKRIICQIKTHYYNLIILKNKQNGFIIQWIMNN